MEKLKKILDDGYDFWKRPKGLSPSSFFGLMFIYDSLRNGRSAEFIQKEIYDVLVKCKIKVKENGIGWIAYK